AVQGAIANVFGKAFTERYVLPEHLVRHLVTSIDNLPEEKVAERIRPVKPAPGAFAPGGTEDEPVLDATNYARYTPLVEVVRNADTQQLVALYKHYYPLFQEAYAILGHP